MLFHLITLYVHTMKGINDMSFCVKNLSKRYKKKSILNNLDFEVETGKSVGLLGPNGAGKTTFIRCCNGLSKMNSGEVSFNNINLKTNFVDYISNISVIFDKSHFYDELSGRQNLKMICKLKACDNSFIDNVSTEVGLEKRIDDKVKNYSFGMKKRLQVAASLIGNPQLIFLDEPFNGLDLNSTKCFVNMFEKIKRNNVTLIVSTHNIQVLDKLVDIVYIINDGDIVGVVEEDSIHDKVLEISSSNNGILRMVEQANIQFELINEKSNKFFIRVKSEVLFDVISIIMSSNIKVNDIKTYKYIEYYYSELLGEYSNEQII